MPKQLTHIHREGTKDNERLKRLQTNFRCSKNNKASIFIYYVYAMRWLGLNLANVQTIEKTMVTKNNPKTSKGSLLLSFVHSIFLYGSMTHFYECCVAHVTRVRSVICVRICARFFCFVFFFNIFFHRVTGEVKCKFFLFIISQFRHRRSMAMMSALTFIYFFQRTIFTFHFVVRRCLLCLHVSRRFLLDLSFGWTVVIHPICLFRASL